MAEVIKRVRETQENPSGIPHPTSFMREDWSGLRIVEDDLLKQWLVPLAKVVELRQEADGLIF